MRVDRAQDQVSHLGHRVARLPKPFGDLIESPVPNPLHDRIGEETPCIRQRFLSQSSEENSLGGQLSHRRLKITWATVAIARTAVSSTRTPVKVSRRREDFCNAFTAVSTSAVAL